MNNPLIEEFFADFIKQLVKPARDMSQTIAEIQVSAMLLEEKETGMWWDSERSALRLRHIAVIQWMEMYGFRSMADLPPDALIAMNLSLKRRLEKLNSPALPHA